MSFFTKFILPNPVSFVRHIQQVLFLNHKSEKDTSTTVDPIVTRAKNLTSQQGVTITTYERTDDG